MAKTAHKTKSNNGRKPGSYRSGIVFNSGDKEVLDQLVTALSEERGGPVNISETIRDAVRFRAKKRGILLGA